MSQSLNVSDIQLFENKKDSLATKSDLAAVELKLSQQISQLRVSIAKTEGKLLPWAFVFWATQLGAIFAFLKLFIR